MHHIIGNNNRISNKKIKIYQKAFGKKYEGGTAWILWNIDTHIYALNGVNCDV